MSSSFLTLIGSVFLVAALGGCGNGDKRAGDTTPSEAKPSKVADKEAGEEGEQPEPAVKEVGGATKPAEPVVIAPVPEPVVAEVAADRGGEAMAGVARADNADLESAQEALAAKTEALDAQKAAAESRARAKGLKRDLVRCEEKSGSVRIQDDTHRRMLDLCSRLPESHAPARESDGWEIWKDRLSVRVRDFRLYSPRFKKWTLLAVDSDVKTRTVSHSGAGHGFGLTVELTNDSGRLLLYEQAVAWATYSGSLGERVCFAESDSDRTWNPYGKKGKGEWVKQKTASEQPFRPGERKRYTLAGVGCIDGVFAEGGVSAVKVDVYLRFATSDGKPVVAGPLVSFERKGGQLTGLPVVSPSTEVKILGRKGLEDGTALYLASDRVLVKHDKRVAWVSIGQVFGATPYTPLATAELPATTAPFSTTYGGVTLSITDITTENWNRLAGAVGQGHKLVTAKVELAIDTAVVEAELAAAVALAETQFADLEAEMGIREAGLEVARDELAAAGDAAAEKKAREGIKTAALELKQAKGLAAKAAKAVTAAKKALAGGVAKYLKVQAKAVDCSSFRLEVGRTSLKPLKGSLDSKACVALANGEPVSGVMKFELERWDTPYAVTWKLAGGKADTYPVASKALGKIFVE